MGNGERIEAEKIRRAEEQIKKRGLLETENRGSGLEKMKRRSGESGRRGNGKKIRKSEEQGRSGED